ncbi:MAG: hypothetical protein D6772_14905, partial [Bacteroidetes bacterium]
LNLKESAQELVDATEMQWKDNTFRPVQPGNTQKWRQQLKARQVIVTEAICREWFEELGYEEAIYPQLHAWQRWQLAPLQWQLPQRMLYNWQLRRQMQKGAS